MNSLKGIIFGLGVTGFLVVNAMNKQCPDTPKKPVKNSVESYFFRFNAQTFERFKEAMVANDDMAFIAIVADIGAGQAYIADASLAELIRLAGMQNRTFFTDVFKDEQARRCNVK